MKVSFKEEEMIEIKNFTKKYNKTFTAVDDLSLTIEDGDIYAFIGHNGAGKTTTIKCMMGILDFSEGDILINGLSIKKEPLLCKEQMAYIPDNPDLYEHLKGIDYIHFIADMYKVPMEKRIENIEKYALMFEIKDALGDEISSYSHGMKQKVAIISALVHEPKVLILDEPFVGLDPISTHHLKEEMKRLATMGITIFFSTHVLDVAEKLCNKIAIIKKGKKLFEGNMQDITKDKSLEEIFVELDQNVEVM